MGTLERWKPAARARTHLLLAGSMWTGVGTGLTVAGARWTLLNGGAWSVPLLGAGVALGLFKGKVALERTAARSSNRILRRGDGKCAGGFLSWKTWLFVVAMMGLGAGLRRSPAPRALLGVIYVAVGTGLLWGSRVFWRAHRSAQR